MKIKISTRAVFLIGKYAIKIPLSKRGYLQGKNESKIWTKYKRYPYLAPLLWEFLGIVCQERCRELDVFDACVVTEVKALMPELDIENCDLYNEENWGIHKEHQVLLDYGINESISKMYYERN